VTATILRLDEDLRHSGRLPPLAAASGQQVRASELTLLLLTGVVASILTNVVRFRLGVPGSSIVFAVFPMALGFALVPRRGAGSVMALGAVMMNGLLGYSGVRLDGLGAQTSLLATGPLLDVALRWGRGGWRLYVAFVVACAGSNSLAFLVRAAAKLYGFGGLGGRHGGGGGGGGGGGRLPFDFWLPQAIWTYAGAGLVAGLLSAAVWFHFRGQRQTRP
jgi:hypothetical protein